MAGDLLDNRGRGDVRWSWPPIHPEGRKFGAVAVLVSLVFLIGFDWEIIGWPLLLLSLGVFAFFRDPERVVPQDDRVILSPADGLVSLIAQVDPPEEMMVDDGTGHPGLTPGQVTRISIFMSVFDVHINRAPIAGTVRRVVYIPGTQIAGLIARRIVPFVKPGDTVGVGQRIGLIRFGSRVDVYLPAGTDPKVLLGQKVVAGETVLAEIGSQQLLEGVAQ